MTERVVQLRHSQAMGQLLKEKQEPEKTEIVLSMLKLAKEMKKLSRRDGHPANTAKQIHSLVDVQLDKIMKLPAAQNVSCRRGCNACCYIGVDVYPNEVALLVRTIREQNLPIDTVRLQKQAEAEMLTDLPYEDRKCVFNDENGECRVYAQRPSACRKYMVVSDPALCHSESLKDVQIMVSFKAEFVDSAAISAFGGGRMATLLHKELQDSSK